jgi:hypothetical protein
MGRNLSEFWFLNIFSSCMTLNIPLFCFFTHWASFKWCHPFLFIYFPPELPFWTSPLRSKAQFKFLLQEGCDLPGSCFCIWYRNSESSAFLFSY